MSQQELYDKLINLPPSSEIVETKTILRQVSKTAAALAELKGIALSIPNQAILINAIVLQEAQDSSEIENIITTRDELYETLTMNDKKTDPSTKEVINYRKAMYKGLNHINEQGFLRINDVIEIQELLVDNTAGIRSTPGTVLKNENTGEIVYTPPQEKAQILELLSNFTESFHADDDTLSPLIRLAILHFQFESIHPFYDGNGRTGRILNILYLLMNGLIDVPILYLSSYIIDNKTEYYQLLRRTNESDNWEEWIIYMLQAVEVTSRHTITKIASIKALLKETITEIQTSLPKIYKKELVELLFEHPYSKIEFVVQRLGVERKAASRYLKSIESIGVLTSRRVGREAVFINTKLIKVLKEN